MSFKPSTGITWDRTAASELLERVSHLTSRELAANILATDCAACRDSRVYKPHSRRTRCTSRRD